MNQALFKPIYKRKISNIDLILNNINKTTIGDIYAIEYINLLYAIEKNSRI